ncbi:hypothetical protein AVEN_89123-1 [Araneus ventricosus]|uniref:Uncharacterized protein n=1 Tax=Araneus ventricosus TaxID=182803 RepID=A0A4Y2B267_ARAVE|nr:hypothetical protein AVEN_89123-1 [Araneus ventricosus]
MPVQGRDAPKLGSLPKTNSGVILQGRESCQVLLRKRMSRGFEFVLIFQTTRGSNFGLLETEVYLTPFIILVFSTCVRSIRESLGETTPAGLKETSCARRASSNPEVNS